ncbi:MAG: hypothetical protein NTW75_17415 [Planctomycetales bacterium]|nr:hypothetical protein [Planctomycetales bacterium]
MMLPFWIAIVFYFVDTVNPTERPAFVPGLFLVATRRRLAGVTTERSCH